MLIGKKKGVQYGLIRPGQTQKPPPPKKALSIFEEDADAPASTGVAGDIARQAAKKSTDTKTASMHAAALAEDPSVFDYDGVFEDLQAKKEKPKAAEPAARRSRYIESLMDKAKDRQREQDIVYEKRLAKERSAEDHLFGDKDRFITSAYKNKLQEEQKWLAEEKIREAIEKRDDVVKRGHMGDFYRNLMHNNVAFGTAGTRLAQAKDESAPDESARDESPAAVDETSAAHPPDRAREASAAAAEEARPGAPVRDAPGGGAAAALAAYKARKDSSAAAPSSDPRPAKSEPPPQQQGDTGPEPQAGRPSSGRAPGSPSAQIPGIVLTSGPGSAVPTAEPSSTGQEGQEAAEEPPDREAKAASAKERYLARKRKAGS